MLLLLYHPKLRGPYVSKPFEQVLGEAKALVDKGVKELIVVAQDTTRYGEDLYGKLRLPELLSELNKLEGLKWIRVMYCYPNNFTDDLIEAFASLDKVCKYVDLPLQHASDRLLSSMNRYDTKSEVEALLNKLRHVYQVLLSELHLLSVFLEKQKLISKN